MCLRKGVTWRKRWSRINTHALQVEQFAKGEWVYLHSQETSPSFRKQFTQVNVSFLLRQQRYEKVQTYYGNSRRASKEKCGALLTSI